MNELFNSAVNALAQVGSTSHSAEFVDLVSTVDELVRKCISTLDFSHSTIITAYFHRAIASPLLSMHTYFCWARKITNGYHNLFL